MPTSKQCWQNAEDCLKLASETNEIYAKAALIELAMEFRATGEELSAELVANPFSTNLHKLFLEVSADAKERFPKRQAKKPEPPPPPPKKPAPVEKAAPPTAAEVCRPSGR